MASRHVGVNVTSPSRALENSCEALELVIPPAEALVRGCCDVGLAQDVRRDCGSKRNKLGGRSHRHSDWDREHGAQDQNNGGPLFLGQAPRSPSIPARPNWRTRAKGGKRDRSSPARSAAGRPPSDSSLSTRAAHARFL